MINFDDCPTGARVLQHLEDIDKSNKEILDQTKETNGRVKKLETWRAYAEGLAAGAGKSGKVFLAVIVAIASAIGSTISFIFNLTT